MSLRVAVFRDEGGFTLAEMLVVCALLGTVMAGVLSLLMVGQQSATATANNELVVKLVRAPGKAKLRGKVL